MLRITASLMWIGLFLSTALAPTALSAGCDKDEYLLQRQQMVARQIKSRGIENPGVLKAMQAVPRHCFVPRHLQANAYQDSPLPIGHGQTISQPYIVALMTELLALKPGDRALEIGTGSGYQAAILAQMGVEVYTIEILEPLAREAQRALKAMGFSGILAKTGDGYKGWPQMAPFDGIIVTCAPTHVPVPLKEQLTEGGRMVIPVGEANRVQTLYLLRKVNGSLKEVKQYSVRFVPMTQEKHTR